MIDLQDLHVYLTQKALDIIVKKNIDYTNNNNDPFANFKASQIFGVAPEIGILIRMTDKMKRIETFVTKGNLQNESVEDSIVDMINYTVLLGGLIEQRKKDS